MRQPGIVVAWRACARVRRPIARKGFAHARARRTDRTDHERGHAVTPDDQHSQQPQDPHHPPQPQLPQLPADPPAGQDPSQPAPPAKRNWWDFSFGLYREDLHRRGWTDTLIRRYMPAPDWADRVNHWRNFRGRYVWHLMRVQRIELREDFIHDYQRSLHVRKASKETIREFHACRVAAAREARDFLASLSEEDRQKVDGACSLTRIMYRFTHRIGYPGTRVPEGPPDPNARPRRGRNAYGGPEGGLE
jgi:hypothetical protein